jgi:hypothetical protein
MRHRLIHLAESLHRACLAPLRELLSTPPVSAVDFPPIPPGSARIWFYRIYDPTESKGRPYMNGAIVGISEQGYAFYRDVLAGLYHVSVESYGRDLF